MDGFYHQDERDYAAGCGTVILCVAVILVIMSLVVVAYLSSTQPKLDGSNAGANAVTKEELESYDK